MNSSCSALFCRVSFCCPCLYIRNINLPTFRIVSLTPGQSYDTQGVYLYGYNLLLRTARWVPYGKHCLYSHLRCHWCIFGKYYPSLSDCFICAIFSWRKLLHLCMSNTQHLSLMQIVVRTFIRDISIRRVELHCWRKIFYFYIDERYTVNLFVCVRGMFTTETRLWYYFPSTKV